MNLYLQMLAAAWVSVFIVDLSGFTDFWRALLASWLKTSPEWLRTVKPFGCSLCVTWWTCIILAACHGRLLEPGPWAAAAALAWFTGPIRAAAVRIRDAVLSLIQFTKHSQQ